jgi:uncharacterized protein (TIGR03083 family)
MTSDQDRLTEYIETWRSAAADVLALLRSLDEEDWARPTDLPGWDVHAVAAHLAHLESELSGVAQREVEVPELAHVGAPTGTYTESGVIARKDLTGSEIADELERAVETRDRWLRANPPSDPRAVPELTPGGIGWSWETLLRNRPFDLWMHEQDIRRAVGRPGGMNTPGATHALTVLSMSFGYAVGKRVAPPAGTTVVADVTGVHPVHLAVEVDAGGRAVPPTETPSEPDVHLRMDAETFVVLGGGRRPVDAVDVAITGDEQLGRAVLEALAVTP